MRLFILRDARERAHKIRGKPVFFSSKTEAKAARDALDNYYHVSYGPDHQSFKKGTKV